MPNNAHSPSLVLYFWDPFHSFNKYKTEKAEGCTHKRSGNPFVPPYKLHDILLLSNLPTVVLLVPHIQCIQQTTISASRQARQQTILAPNPLAPGAPHGML